MTSRWPVAARYLMWASIAALVELAGLIVGLWPEDWALVGLALVLVCLTIHALVRYRWLRRAAAWTFLLVGLVVPVVIVMCAFLTPLGIVMFALGLGPALVIRHYWPRFTYRPPVIRRAMLEPLPRGSGSGATLISVLAALGIIAICLTLTLQAYVGGSRFVAIELQRSRALAACQMQVEQARAAGYAALPAPGEHAFEVPGNVRGEGLLMVRPGPVGESRRIAARVAWPADGRMPAGRAELVTIMTARGVGG